MQNYHTVSPVVQLQQEVWLLGSADMICPRRPLRTQVQHLAKMAQTDHVTLRLEL